MGKNANLPGFMIILFGLVFLGLAPSHLLVPKATAASFTPEPIVRDFSVTPTSVVPGESVTVSWRVDANSQGSPVSAIRINGFNQTIYNGTDLYGSRSFNIPVNTSAPAAASIELQVSTRDGKTYNRSIGCQLASFEGVKRSISLIQPYAGSPVVAAGANTIRINNQSTARLTGVQLDVVRRDPLNPDSKQVVASQPGLTLNPGANNYNVNIAGIDSQPGQLSVILLYGSTMPKRQLAEFNLPAEQK